MTYPGGKGRMYQRLISLIPSHRVYIETHLGGGAVLRQKRPAAVNIGIDIDPAVIAGWRTQPLQATTLIAGDALAFLRTYAFRGDEFIYCDPPYLRASRRRAKVYRFDYEDADHLALLTELKRLPCKVMLSGYPSMLYDRELDGWRSVRSVERTHVGPAMEVVWMNYEPPTVLHDYSHVGANFREREAIKRRRDGMLSRIRSLPSTERDALLAELVAEQSAFFAAALQDLR